MGLTRKVLAKENEKSVPVRPPPESEPVPEPIQIEEISPIDLVPLTNVCKESKSSPRLNCVESATCERQQ